MRVLVAPGSFTGTLTAVEAAHAIATGWRRYDAAAELDLAPLSDGGTGFVDALAVSVPGERHVLQVTGATGDLVAAHVLRTADGTVYVESAPVCGTTSGGLGLVLAAVRDRLLPERVVLGVGDVEAGDEGRGALEALGGPDAWPGSVPLVLAASAGGRTYRAGGADSAGGGLVQALTRLGGVSASGVQTVLDAVRLPQRAEAADLLLTGEGTFDAGSLQGQVPKGVAWVAQRAGRPCVVLAGRVLIGRREFSAAGVDAAYAVEESAGSLAAARAEPGPRLADLAERVARGWTPRGA